MRASFQMFSLTTTSLAMPRSRASAMIAGSASVPSLLSTLTRMRPRVADRNSRSVETVSGVATRPASITSRHVFISVSVRSATSPLQVVVRSSQLSCMITSTPSFERRTSTSTISAPAAIASSTAASEFSGNRALPACSPPERWATTMTWSRHWLALCSRSRICAARPVSAATAGKAASIAATAAPNHAIRIENRSVPDQSAPQ